MNYVKIWLLFVAVPSFLHAQPKTIRVPAGSDPLGYFPLTERYRYKEFYLGTLFGQDGKPAMTDVKLNIHLVTGDVVRIAENGDTVTVENNDNRYPHVQIRSDFFVHADDREYYLLLQKSQNAKLVSRLAWKISRRDEVESTGYGQSSGDRRDPSIKKDPSTNKYIRNEDLVYSKMMSYYLLDSELREGFATQARFIDLFPEYKKEIKGFVKEQNIDFLKEEDLRRLFKYCLSISKG